MEECSYCGESFADEEAYLRHLHAEHDDDLSRIDRRRVDAFVDEGRDLPTGPLIIGGLVVLTAIVIAYVAFGVNASGQPAALDDVQRTPTAVGSGAAYGTINVSIDGERLDFSRARYRSDDPAFAFVGEDGHTWRIDAENVTLEYALATVGIEVTESSVSSRATTYREADPGTSVTVEVDGQAVDPATYVLEGAPDRDRAAEGDHVHIAIRTR